MDKISTVQLETLDAPITLEEVKLIIVHFKTNTAPGVDGLTSESYKTFMEDIALAL